MKRALRIVCVILTLLVMVAVIAIAAENNICKTEAMKEIRLIEEAKTQRDRHLAVLVSNQDFPIYIIDAIATSHGFDGYDSMVNYLTSIGELYHIPGFVYESNGYKHEYRECYTVKNSGVYCSAVEMGIIEE